MSTATQQGCAHGAMVEYCTCSAYDGLHKRSRKCIELEKKQRDAGPKKVTR